MACDVIIIHFFELMRVGECIRGGLLAILVNISNVSSIERNYSKIDFSVATNIWVTFSLIYLGHTISLATSHLHCRSLENFT